MPAAGTDASATLAGLPSSTSYDVYAVATDPAGNRRGPPATATASTLAAQNAGDEENTARRGTSVKVKFGPAGIVTIEIRNPRTSRPVSVPLGGVQSDGVVYRRATYEFHTRASAVRVELRPGERDGTDPAITDVRVLTYFAVRRVGDGPSPFSTVTFEVQVRESALPADASLDEVAFYRYFDGRWTPLEFARGGDTFRVTTEGFSSFAVAVPAEPTPTRTATSSTADPPLDTTTASPAPTPTETATRTSPAVATPGSDHVTAALTIGVIAVLAVAAVLWRRHRDRR